LPSPLAPGGLSACRGVHRPPVPRAGQTARPGNPGGQQHDRAERELRRQPHRRPGAAAHRVRDRSGHVPGGGVGPAGSRRRRSSPWWCGGSRPSMWPSRCPRAAGSWSWVDSSSGAGRLRTAPLGRWSRSWPRSWGRACVGQRRRRPGRRGARSRRVPRRPGRLNERHPASWKLWLQDCPRKLGDERGDCRGMV
jgi:hypothetical protein